MSDFHLRELTPSELSLIEALRALRQKHGKENVHTVLTVGSKDFAVRASESLKTAATMEKILADDLPGQSTVFPVFIPHDPKRREGAFQDAINTLRMHFKAPSLAEGWH